MPTYADLIKRENCESNFLVVIKRRYLLTDWVLITANKHYHSFTDGIPRSIFDEQSRTFATEVAPADWNTGGEWYYDSSTQHIYWITPFSALSYDINDAAATTTIEFYAATSDIVAGRIPTDASSDKKLFEGRLRNAPTVKADVEDSELGIVNTTATSISLDNSDGWLNPWMHEGSFSKADIDIYHQAGKGTDAKTTCIFKGYISEVTWEQSTIDFTLRDRNEILGNEFRNYDVSVGLKSIMTPPYWTDPELVAFWNDDMISGISLDPMKLNTPLRHVYGKRNGVVPVNLEYVQSSPTTSDNRYWAVCVGDEPDANITRSYVSQTTGKVTLDDITGIEVGDTICLHTSGDYPPALVPGYGFKVTALYPATNQLGHAGTTLSLPGGTVKARRSAVASVSWIGPDGAVNELIDGKHYSYAEDTDLIYTSSGQIYKMIGFKLNADFETDIYGSIGVRVALAPSDKIWCTVYGMQPDFSIDGVAVPTADNGSLENGVAMIYDLLIKAGYSESDIDVDTFNDLISDLEQPCGLLIPEKTGEGFPTYRDLIGRLLKSLGLRMLIDSNGLWTLKKIAPTGTPDYVITDKDIMNGSVSIRYDYGDVKNVVAVGYDGREIGIDGFEDRNYRYAQKSYNTTKGLNRVQSQMSANSALKNWDDASALAEHLAFQFGERRALMSVGVHNELMQAEIGDVVRVTRDKLPGYEYVPGTERTRDMVIVGISKTIGGVDLVLDDQKGIEDNEGDW